ncbi:PAS domain-containing protein [Paracoccus sp. P2]|uniref:PAS domain-containing protein n=1 Tax=Paracoccus pantotrophus TaxID=82367 RepID=A0A7H9BVB9_PARPN|nr:PAS domain-containing protein [Paracoccus pantotrophus]MDF3855073.1 PAS domain-containing protein [Paracoccus pantotrophus]QLH14815.1 PAS domain-containing protein [Paracoccus pantotrophus]RDD99767.1 PAS domain-containing protein [Paracoccus pantotrophus]RNI17988.1 PAS domain-containing protein [Paracoccus pantotrophus]WGR64961.1 PAS domain-containing protein [Paracoccus pantotrophus]
MTQIQRLHHDLEWAMRAMGSHRAVLILDRAGHIVAVNQSYLGMCGYRREELVGRPVVMLLDPADWVPDRIRRMLGMPDGCEARLHHLVQVAKSGRRFRVDARICPIRDDGGRVCLTVLFLREPVEEAGSQRPALPRIAGMGQVIPLPRHRPAWPRARPGRSGWSGTDMALCAPARRDH